jgi:hypothetical protein
MSRATGGSGVVRWTRRLLAVAAFGCLWINALDDPPLHTGAYLLDVGLDGATIGLVTAAPERVAATVRDANGVVVATLPADAARRRHRFPVAGLAAGAEFTFELVGERGQTWPGRIRTAPDRDTAPVRFAFLGDSGDQPWWVWLQRTPALHWPARWGWFADSPAVTGIGAAVAAYRPEFVLHLGDVIYPRGLHAHYRPGFFRPFAAVLREAPIYAVLGNHDVMEDGGTQILANLRAPSPTFAGDGRSFSLARGSVRVIGLDCNSDYTGTRYEPGHPAQRFLAEELAKRSEPWVLVASHFPMRSQSRQGNRAELLVALLPELAANGVSLYLSGHDHCYQRFGEPGDGGPVLVVSGGGGKDLYDVRPAQHGPQAARLAKAFHWCAVEASGGRLEVRATGLDGGVLDAFVLGLPTGSALAEIRRRNPARAKRIDALAK